MNDGSRSKLRRVHSEPFLDEQGHLHSGENWRKFVYTPLDVQKKEIRLLHILSGSDIDEDPECEVSVRLIDERPYMAISYVWGDPDDFCHVFLNGYRVKVTRSAHTVLKHIRRHGMVCTWWIDALCINQADTQERNNQVRLMKDIYSVSAMTCLWLADLGKADAKAYHVLKKMAQCADHTIWNRDWTPGPERAVTLDQWKCLESFFTNPFWRRVWIVHECALGAQRSKITAHLGILTLSYRELILVEAYVQRFGSPVVKDDWLPDDEFQAPFRTSLLTIAMRAFNVAVYWWHFGDNPFSDLQAGQLTAVSIDLQATDPRDRIYGLLSLYPVELDIQPRYENTVEQVYFDAMFEFLRHGPSLKLLMLCGNKQFQPNGVVPSWVVDWRNRPAINRRRRLWSNSFFASGGLSAPIRRADLRLAVRVCRLFRVDSHTSVSLQPPRSLDTGVIPRIINMLAHCSQIYSKTATALANNAPAYTTARLEADFRRTLFLDVAHNFADTGWRRLTTNATLPCKASRVFNQLGAMLTTGPDTDAVQRIFESSDSVVLEMEFWRKELKDKLKEHKLYINPSRKLCVLPEETQEGDEVVVICGACVPFVLRPVLTDAGPSYRLVGAAYVHDMMDGEAVMDSPKRMSTGDPDPWDGAFLEKVWLV